MVGSRSMSDGGFTPMRMARSVPVGKHAIGGDGSDVLERD